jgi:hypothetical protein
MTATDALVEAFWQEKSGYRAPQSFDCATPITRYDETMEEENKHTMRLAVALVGLVAVLFVAALNLLTGGEAQEQQATVLRVYAE